MGILVTFGQTKVTASRQHYKSAPKYPRLEPYAKVKNRINNSGPSHGTRGGIARIVSTPQIDDT